MVVERSSDESWEVDGIETPGQDLGVVVAAKDGSVRGHKSIAQAAVGAAFVLWAQDSQWFV